MTKEDLQIVKDRLNELYPRRVYAVIKGKLERSGITTSNALIQRFFNAENVTNEDDYKKAIAELLVEGDKRKEKIDSQLKKAAGL